MTITTKGFRTDVLTGTLGTIIAYVIGILLLPIITHFYKPEHIGTWQILLGLISFLIPLATLRLEDAIILEKSVQTSTRLLSVILLNTSVISICLFAGSFLLNEETKTILNLEINQYLFWMASLGVIIQTSFLVLNAIIVKHKAFKVQAISKILGAIVIPVIALSALLIVEVNHVTYIFAGLSAILLQSLLMFRYSPKKYFKGIFNWNKEKTYAAIKKYRAYPLYMVPYTLSQGAIWQVTILSLGILFSASTVGAYAVARQLVFMPVSLLTTGLKHVVFSYASSAPKYDENINIRIRKLLVNIINFSIPFAVFGFFYLSNIINFALGDGWEKAGEFSRWIIIAALTMMLTSWLDRIFDVYGRQRLAVSLQVSSDILFLLVLLACYLIKADATSTVAVISIFLAIYNLVWLHIVLNILGITTKFWFTLILKIFLITFISFSVIKSLELLLPFSLALSADLLLLSATSYYTYTKIRINP